VCGICFRFSGILLTKNHLNWIGLCVQQLIYAGIIKKKQPNCRQYRQERELADKASRRRIRHLGPLPQKCGRMPARPAPMLFRGPGHHIKIARERSFSRKNTMRVLRTQWAAPPCAEKWLKSEGLPQCLWKDILYLLEVKKYMAC
jgi:hypothetical protein